jgi:hypothetical protein
MPVQLPRSPESYVAQTWKRLGSNSWQGNSPLHYFRAVCVFQQKIRPSKVCACVQFIVVSCYNKEVTHCFGCKSCSKLKCIACINKSINRCLLCHVVKCHQGTLLPKLSASAARQSALRLVHHGAALVARRWHLIGRVA